MKIDLVTKLVIHELRSLGPDQQSDRRGPICDLMLADIPNTEHAIDVATRVIQRVCSLLDDSYFWSDNRDKGPSEFTEQFEAWIDPMPVYLEGKAVRIRHKYWSQGRIDGFLAIMLELADLHGWEVDDRRSLEHEPGDREEEEFLEAVGKLNPEAGPEEVAELAESYADSAHHMDTCPWRLLALDTAGICHCSPGEGDWRTRELVQNALDAGVDPGAVIDRVEAEMAGQDAKVIPFRRKP
jgi:hypothetical protein